MVCHVPLRSLIPMAMVLGCALAPFRATAQSCDLTVPDDHAVIQDAIDAAISGQTVCVSPGTYYGLTDLDGKDVHLLGTAGAASTILDGAGSTVLHIQSGETALAEIEGFTITGGTTGIYIYEASPTLTDLVVEGISNAGISVSGASAAPSASGVEITGNTHGIVLSNFGSLTLTDSVLEGNDGTGAAGGISLYTDTDLVAERVQILDNAGANGGGLYIHDGATASLLDCTIEGNSTTGNYGAGLYADDGAIVTLENVDVVDNTGGSGAGIALNNLVQLTATNVKVADNTGTGHGGGIFVHSYSEITASQLTVAGNSAGQGGGIYLTSHAVGSLTNAAVLDNEVTVNGGGIGVHESTLDVTNGVSSGNVADGDGGGLWANLSTVTLRNTSIDGNTASGAGGGILSTASTVTATYGNVADNSPDEYSGMTDPTGVDGNLSVSPVYLDVTDADATLWDLHLALTSPLIDAGAPNLHDPDGGNSDIGIYGWAGADEWDRDSDGYGEWWQPGAYQDAYALDDLDCDDRDEAVVPHHGCGCDDADYDGFLDLACGGDDCDDGDDDVNPDADEVCDGEDNDCDGTVDEDDAIDASTWYLDDDGDGYGDPAVTDEACDAPAGYVGNDEDCDDGDGDANPGADEYCDGHDDDCDGDVDEDDAVDASTWYHDGDGDGYGDPADSVEACDQPADHVANAEDCDDGDGAVNPDADEVCDGEDNDCDGTVDEDDAIDASTWYLDDDGDGYGDPAVTDEACDEPTGYVGNDEDCDDGDGDANPGADEYCDGHDDDCDGAVDEDDAVDAPTWYQDLDGDGYGTAAVTDVACEAPTGFVDNIDDCDDTDDGQYPGADEFCNGEDDDCDGTVDEDDAVDASTWYRDADGDGYGDPGDTDVACDMPNGYIADDADCDDGDGDQYPGADEFCNGEDDDCDGTVDEDDAVDASTWYADGDGDGYGDAGATTAACVQPAGHVANDDDCDDGDASQHPGADELCNGEDDDCDAVVDEDQAVDALTWYLDGDGDGYGNGAVTDLACDPPPGYVADATDCDDGDASQHPGADEVCNGEDDDCLGDVDEDDAVDVLTWYHDGDGDGHGDAGQADVDCDQPPGYVADGDDCDDTNALVHPGGPELCDQVDNDCNGQVDDGVTTQDWWPDGDGDGYGDAGATPVQDCAVVADHALNDADCDDGDPLVSPAALEICDGIDNDCDGTADGADADDAIAWYLDGDGDGFGDLAAQQIACSAPADHVADPTDCDDGDPAQYPGADETCNGEDDDCDQQVDEDDALDVLIWYQDVDGDGFGNDAETDVDCDQPPGYVAADGDCDDLDALVSPAEAELCNGIDDDCDGGVDEDDALDVATWYGDLDGDGFGDAADAIESCDPPDGYVDNGDDCDDVDPLVNPVGDELCDGLDNDCDGVADGEDALDALPWYEDLDGDGWGDPDVEDVDCDQPPGFVAVDGDCDDLDPAIHPDADEICNGVDDDCDVTTNEQVDGDGDGWSICDDDCDDGEPDVAPDAPEVCDGLDNDCDPTTDELADEDGDFYSICTGDCDDDDATVSPASPELCDGLDNDCDGYLAEDEVDEDGDGQMVCGGDCDDGDAWTYTGAPEQCDGIDNDCDGAIDDGVDDDPDLDGYNACQGDCDNDDPNVYPFAVEICDGKDDDCDGDLPLDELDEDDDGWLVCDGDCDDLDADLNLDDGDGDGSSTCEGDCDDGDEALTPDDLDGDGYSTCDDDCDDGEPAAHPDAVEICDDGIDNDCDGAADADDPECDPTGDDDDTTGDDDDSTGDDDTTGDDDDSTADDDTFADDDDDTAIDEPQDCSCRLDGDAGASPAWILAALALAVTRRRR